MRIDLNVAESPRVLLVEDSPIELAIIKKILLDNGINVVGTATNGVEALAQIPLLNPDVICTDYHMPQMDGLELTKKVMEQYPRPILVLSISAQDYQMHNIMNILKAGALDVMAKPLPNAGGVGHTDAKKLVEKIKILSGVKVIPNRSYRTTPNVSPRIENHSEPKVAAEIIGIGSSTGGPQALLSILSNLPESFSIPIVCVQHISRGFLPGFVEWLDSNARLRVVVAEAGIAPRGGYVYIAPDGQHLVLDDAKRFKLIPANSNEIHLPSIDFLFKSLAEVYKNHCVGIVLSGMGSDGTQGIEAIHRNGGLTLAQDEDSSIIFGMPKSALDTGAVNEVLSLGGIFQKLLALHSHC